MPLLIFILILLYLFTNLSIHELVYSANKERYILPNWFLFIAFFVDAYVDVDFLFSYFDVDYLSIFGIDALNDVYFDFALFIYVFIDRFIDLSIRLFCVENTKEYQLAQADLFDNFFVDVYFHILLNH